MITLTFAQRENIGFQYILDSLQPCSPYGAERVRELTPFEPKDKPELLRQLTNLQKAVRAKPQERKALSVQEDCHQTEPAKISDSQDISWQKALDQLLLVFMTVKNVRPTAKKCLEAPLNEIELFELKRFLLKCEEMYPLFQRVQERLHFQEIWMEDTTAALDLLDPEHHRVASFFLGDGSSSRLRVLRREKRELEERLRRLAPGAEREEVQALRAQTAAEEEREEMRIRAQLSEALRPHVPAMLHNMEAIGEIDLTMEKARLARKYGGVMPEFTKARLEMTDMVNPQIADLAESRGKTFTPVSIALEQGATVITGANMGGKSVALKTIALNVLLIQCGFFPFAKKAAAPLFDSMHILSEDLESIDRGLSSFGGEMVRFNQVVRQLDQGFAFILLDEFARGTNPDEGAAIVQAVTEYLNRRKVMAVLATHYDNVASRANAHYQVIGLKDLNVEKLRAEIAALSGEVGVELIARHMNYGLYRVEDREDCPRDALNICRLLGMDPNILEIVEKNYGQQAKNY